MKRIVLISAAALTFTSGLATHGVANAQTGSPPGDPPAQGRYMWSYAAKFVCGYQAP